MFEQSLQTEEWKDQQAAEGRTADEIRAVRSAAVIIVVNTVVTVALELVAGTKVNFLPAVAAVVLGYYLTSCVHVPRTSRLGCRSSLGR